MESPRQLARRCRELFLHGRWIANTNYREALEALRWEDATRKIGPHNSIAALTFHLGYYLGGVNQVFAGGELEIRDQYSFDIPEIRSAEDWRRLRDELYERAERFAAHVEALPEEQLDDIFVKEAYGTYRRNIEAMIEHGYYHLGQVVLLGKLME